MGVNLDGFDADKVESTGPRGAVPKGDYQVIIVKTEAKPTSAGNGHLLKIELQVVEGEFTGSKIWDNLNLWNENQTAKRIAEGTLKAICLAIGIPRPRNSEELHNRQLTAVVDVKEHEGKTQNKVKAYKPRQSSMAAPVAGPASPTGKANPFG
jgi:hypothetical protein